MELTDILRQIDSLKKEAENLQPVKPDPIAIGLEKVFWDKFRLEFNYNSNHMEGNTLTYGHTQILLKSGDVVGKYNIRELQEMKAHDLALKIIRESAENAEFTLSQKFIREINEIILVEPYYNDAITQDGRPTQKLIVPGEYKKTPNSVRLANGEMFNYPSPEETPALMGDLIDWYEKETIAKELHPVQIAALFHYKIVRIHPFDDSNGRTSRLLMNYILLKNGYAPLVINSSDKKNYLIALNEADAGDIEAFVKYIILLQLHWQELYLKALKGGKIEEDDDFEKEVELLKKKITEDKKITQKITVEAVDNLFHTSLKDLFIRLWVKLSSLDSLFYSKAIHFGINKGFRAIIKTEQIEKVFEENKLKITDRGTMHFRYIHKALPTKSNGVTDIYSDITVRFDDYTYSIEIEQNKKIFPEKRYGEYLSENEIKEVVSLLSNKTLETIKTST